MTYFLLYFTNIVNITNVIKNIDLLDIYANKKLIEIKS